MLRKMHFMGNYHNGAIVYINYFVYDEDSNSWSDIPQTTVPNNHGYAQTAVDPKTGIVYRSRGGSNVTYKLPVGGSWETMSPAWNNTVTIQVNFGSDWWTGQFDGAGANGGWVTYNSGGGGQILFYDPLANNWVVNGSDISGIHAFSTYHSDLRYSPQYNVAIFGGGNDTPQKVWRLNADHSYTALTDSPVNWGTAFSNVTADPTTGKFLFVGYGQFWELNPSGLGTWTQLATPPAAIDNPQSTGGENELVSWPVPASGINAYVYTAGGGAANMYLYKHSISAPIQPQLGLVLR